MGMLKEYNISKISELAKQNSGMLKLKKLIEDYPEREFWDSYSQYQLIKGLVKTYFGDNNELNK